MPRHAYPNPTNLLDIHVNIIVVSMFSTFFFKTTSTNQKVRFIKQMGEIDGCFDG